MVAGEGDLRGPREVEVVGLEPVDLVGVGVQEPGAAHDLRRHEGGRDHGDEAVLDGLVQREVHHRDLEPGADALEEVEPRPADPAALHVDGVEGLAEREVVPGLEVGARLADGLEHDVVVLTADRDAGLDDVADAAHERVEQLLRLVGGRLQRLDPGGHLLGLREQGLLGLALRLGDLLAHRLLLGPQALELGEGGAAALVGCEDLVDDPLVLATGTLRGAHPVGVLAQELDVDHRASLSGAPLPEIARCHRARVRLAGPRRDDEDRSPRCRLHQRCWPSPRLRSPRPASGPNLLYIVSRGIAQGRRAALASTLGVTAATAVFVVLTAFGLTALIASSVVAFSVVKYAGVAYLVYLAVREFRSTAGSGWSSSTAGELPAGFRRRVRGGITNPKVALFFLAFFPQFVHADAGPVTTQVLVLGAVFVAIGVTSDSAYALAPAPSAAGSPAARRGDGPQPLRERGTIYLPWAGRPCSPTAPGAPRPPAPAWTPRRSSSS